MDPTTDQDRGVQTRGPQRDRRPCYQWNIKTCPRVHTIFIVSFDIFRVTQTSYKEDMQGDNIKDVCKLRLCGRIKSTDNLDIKPNESLRLTRPGNAWPELRARRSELFYGRAINGLQRQVVSIIITLMMEMTASDMMSGCRLLIRYSKLFAGTMQSCAKNVQKAQLLL